MACACDVVMNEDSSSAHQSHQTETHNSDQHHAPDGPCEGCEHCNDKPVFAETKTQTITFKIGQQVEPSIILASDNDFIEGAPPTVLRTNWFDDEVLHHLHRSNLKFVS